ncbi:MAG: hypothetical protein DRG78_18190 [Epsilonproteobacteria bacterium]|nr:MAG: hypothetical protein DRG78_18190 [Campylobacterota bacterium]
MNKNKEIKARVDYKLLSQVNKKLTLKKFNNFTASKFLRAAINNFIEKDLFNYIANTNAIIKILNDIKVDLAGVPANVTQIIEHIENDTDTKQLVLNLKTLSNRNADYIKEINKLIKLLTPFDDKRKKESLIKARIEESIYLDILIQLNQYTNLKLDISKFIRAALKYYLDKKYYTISDNKIKLARELISNSNQIGLVSNEINRIAFTLNVGEPVGIKDITNASNELNEFSELTHHLVNKLYDESLREF